MRRSCHDYTCDQNSVLTWPSLLLFAAKWRELAMLRDFPGSMLSFFVWPPSLGVRETGGELGFGLSPV